MRCSLTGGVGRHVASAVLAIVGPDNVIGTLNTGWLGGHGSKRRCSLGSTSCAPA